MGLLNETISSGLNSLGISSSRSVDSSKMAGPDFPEGFQIVEYVDGREAEKIILAGSFMPLQPFKFGGKQEIKKDYYPGNSEPTVQVLGPREDDIEINGRLKIKRLKDESLREVAVEYQKQIEAMRIRGNLVKIKLRDWYRYAFIESAEFDLNTKRDIVYRINFSVIGFNPPKNNMFLSGTDSSPVEPNKQLIAKASELLASSQAYPASFPRSVTDILNEAIGDVAGAINLVTGFVTGILDDAEALNASANRALGLIKNARATISKSARRVSQISMSVQNLGSSFMSEAQKTSATITNVTHLHKVQSNNQSLSALLAELQSRFANIVKTMPFKRHLVRQGDTLQRISITYYNTADNWKRIYDHNKLQSTTLEVGKVLEIPRV